MYFHLVSQLQWRANLSKRGEVSAIFNHISQMCLRLPLSSCLSGFASSGNVSSMKIDLPPLPSKLVMSPPYIATPAWILWIGLNLKLRPLAESFSSLSVFPSQSSRKLRQAYATVGQSETMHGDSMRGAS